MGQRGYSLDEDDEDGNVTPTSRHRPSPKAKPVLSTILNIVSLVAWACLFLAVACGGLLFCGSLSKAQSAPQEAALGAVFSTVFIGLYIIIRCVEKFAASLERLRSK